MDVAQTTMIGHHLQHPLGPGAILYPGKGSAWQTVVTSLPSMVDIPKESIIANMDFTTTSVIAKRRLSSKKRKKVASQLQQSCEGGASGSSDKCSSCSPMGSANGSPAVTSTTCTPPAFDSKSNQSQDDLVNRSTSISVSAQNVMTSSHAGITTSSSAHLPHHIGHHPHVAATTGAGVKFHHHSGVTANGQFISVAPSITSVAYHHPTVATAQTQFANPMLSQLQQELNYRFLQDRSSGVLIAHPNHVDHSHQQHPLNGLKQHEPDRRDSSQAMDTASSSSMGASVGVVKQPGFKWCYAHVAIAKQIQQQQQQQQRAKELCGSSTSSSAIALDQSHMTSGSRVADVAATIPSASVAAAAAAHQQQQQQQQLALLQMYSLPAAVPAAPMPGSYMAVPYSSVQEVQLQMHQLAAVSNVHTGISLVKPVGMDSMAHGTATESMLSLNPGGGVQMVNSLHLQAAPFAAASHTVPLAAVAAAPSNLNNAVFHSSTSGQWMAPVPVVGSCIVNPLQPGIMTAPWVK